MDGHFIIVLFQCGCVENVVCLGRLTRLIGLDPFGLVTVLPKAEIIFGYWNTLL